MQEIEFYCKKCRKTMKMSYELTGDKDAPVMNGLSIVKNRDRFCHSKKTYPYALRLMSLLNSNSFIYSYTFYSNSHFKTYILIALSQMVQANTLTKESLVWKEGMAEWVEAGEVADLNSIFGSTPPPIPGKVPPIPNA